MKNFYPENKFASISRMNFLWVTRIVSRSKAVVHFLNYILEIEAPYSLLSFENAVETREINDVMKSEGIDNIVNFSKCRFTKK